MSFEVVNNRAVISGNNGTEKLKGAAYGKNAAANHFSYINSLANSSVSLNADTFTKNSSLEDMEKAAKSLNQESFTPVNFLLKYAPKKAFFASLFTGKIDKQALLGFSEAAMDGKKSVSVEQYNKDLNQAFSETGIKLTAEAFDVNNDGQIDIAESAVSTVLADILSKKDTDGAISKSDIKLSKADGSYTNEGENLMMAFCNEKNVAAASEIVTELYSDMKLSKALAKYTTQG